MSQATLIENGLTHSAINAFYEVYNHLGYGFLENVYITALERELTSRGHIVSREFGARIIYKGEFLCTYRLDMVVDDKLIVEVKSTELLPPNALRQLRSYLHSTDFEVGLLLHFGPMPKFYWRILTNDQKQTNKSVVP